MGWFVKERRGENRNESQALSHFVHRILFRSSYYVRANQAASLFGEGHFPWGVLLMLVLLLLLVSKQSYFHSLWYPTL
ncbi:BnaC09g08870D [Brassica napus]|uniref:BnaC09g08870D protein n=1 Tax=Brassica napus TaxID=3708 RepID=A0A078GJP3_BRANA|nr:BnaC09g08870D [Brassica napus]